MNREYFITLADYNCWANHIAMEWLKEINNEQWEQSVTSSFNSIKQTVVHIASAEKIWIDFWENVPNPIYLSAGFKGTKDDLIEIWQKSSAGLKAFIEKYPEENYFQYVTFRYPRGGEGRMEFSQTFAHIMNHSTYHRGQLVAALRQVGFTNFSSTDLATYYHVISRQL